MNYKLNDYLLTLFFPVKGHEIKNAPSELISTNFDFFFLTLKFENSVLDKLFEKVIIYCIKKGLKATMYLDIYFATK